MNARQFEQLKTRLGELKQEKAKKMGVLEEKRIELKESFGCSTVKQARKLLDKIQKELAEQTELVDSGVEEIESFLSERGF